MLLRNDSFRRLCLARDLLQEEREQPLSIDDIARAAGISPFHFIRQFEAVFGLTPHQFRMESRLGRAKALLAGSEHSVTDVCMEVGFSSLGSFSALFSRRVGLTPSEYRRRALTARTAETASRVPGCLGMMSALPASAFAVFEKRDPSTL